MSSLENESTNENEQITAADSTRTRHTVRRLYYGTPVFTLFLCLILIKLKTQR